MLHGSSGLAAALENLFSILVSSKGCVRLYSCFDAVMYVCLHVTGMCTLVQKFQHMYNMYVYMFQCFEALYTCIIICLLVYITFFPYALGVFVCEFKVLRRVG